MKITITTNNANEGKKMNTNTNTIIYNADNGRINLNNVQSINELKAAIDKAFEQGFMPIDARQAYNSALNDSKLNNAALNLKNIFENIARLFELSGKPAGVSTIYNVIDARIVRKVSYTKKLATGLGSSLKLSEFAALVANANRANNAKKVHSCNGTEYMQNRCAYNTTYENAKGKVVSIRKAQAANSRKAILAGQAMPVSARPNAKRQNILVTIFNNIFDKQIALPENTKRERGKVNTIADMPAIAL